MNLKKFLKQIHQTQEDEIVCSDCLEQVDQYVDLELSGQPAEGLMPHLKHHLDQCPVCHEEYQLLLDLARQEQGGQLQSIDDLKKGIRK